MKPVCLLLVELDYCLFEEGGTCITVRTSNTGGLDPAADHLDRPLIILHAQRP